MIDFLRPAYNGKKVFVTGHTGFKGSWLTLWLRMMGADVVGYSLYPNTSPNHFNALSTDIQSHIGDIRDRAKMDALIQEIDPDIIFHLAAQPLVRYSYKDPVETYESNLIGSLNVLESARKLKNLKAIVCITTDKVYENYEKPEGYTEEQRLGGFDPYSSSKACVEIMVNSYRNSFFNLNDYQDKHQVLIGTTRAGNVIGGGDWSEDRLVPDIIRAAANNASVHIRNPFGVRPWQHVLEPLYGYLLLGKELLIGDKSFSGAWNFGPKINRLMKNTELAEECQKHWGKVNIELGSGDGLHETSILMLNSEKSIDQLGWNPVWSYEEAIKHTIIWYRSFYEEKVLLTEQQIDQYINEI